MIKSEKEREEMLPLPRIEPLFRMERPTQLITSQSLGSTHKLAYKLLAFTWSRVHFKKLKNLKAKENLKKALNELIMCGKLLNEFREEKKLPLLPHSRQSAVPAAISSLPDKPLPRLPPTADSLAFYPAPSLAPALDSSQTPTASTPYRKRQF